MFRLSPLAKTAVLLSAFTIGIAFILWNTENHHLFSAKYNLWKLGLYELPNESSLKYKFLNVDIGFRESLVGKKTDELKKLYPLIPRGSGNKYQKFYEINVMGNESYFWLGESAWAAKIRGGRVVDIQLFKG